MSEMLMVLSFQLDEPGWPAAVDAEEKTEWTFARKDRVEEVCRLCRAVQRAREKLLTEVRRLDEPV
jgi:hypothetical protein